MLSTGFTATSLGMANYMMTGLGKLERARFVAGLAYLINNKAGEPALLAFLHLYNLVYNQMVDHIPTYPYVDLVLSDYASSLNKRTTPALRDTIDVSVAIYLIRSLDVGNHDLKNNHERLRVTCMQPYSSICFLLVDDDDNITTINPSHTQCDIVKWEGLPTILKIDVPDGILIAYSE